MAPPLAARALRPLAPYLTLLRPLNLAGIALAAWTGARLAHADPREAGAALLVPVLIGAFGYARNDAVDLAADRVNRPGRPLPSGAVTPARANAIAGVALLLAALLVAWRRSDPASIAIAAASTALLAAYSPWLKDRSAAGPAAIALLTLLTLVWGAVGGPSPERVIVPGLLAAVAQFARECVKQLEDVPGDRAVGRSTWAVTAGAGAVSRAARLAIVAALLLLPLPSTAGGLRPLYLAIALPAAGGLFLWALLALRGAAPRYGRVSAALKGALFGGLAALVLVA